MMKICFFDTKGNLINIGEWDYQEVQEEVSPAVINEETGEVIEHAVYETVIRNPMPEGAFSEEREVSQDSSGGWYIPGQMKEPTVEERLQAAEDAVTLLLGI